MILITVLILTSIITVTLISAEIIRNGIVMSRTQVYSTIAYFAAEAGAERFLYDIRYGDFDPEGDASFNKKCIVFDPSDPLNNGYNSCDNTGEVITLDNEAEYFVKFESDINTYSYATSTGSYNDVKRVIKLKY